MTTTDGIQETAPPVYTIPAADYQALCTTRDMHLEPAGFRPDGRPTELSALVNQNDHWDSLPYMIERADKDLYEQAKRMNKEAIVVSVHYVVTPTKYIGGERLVVYATGMPVIERSRTVGTAEVLRRR
jgi:hypothetical protein